MIKQEYSVLHPEYSVILDDMLDPQSAQRLLMLENYEVVVMVEGKLYLNYIK